MGIRKIPMKIKDLYGHSIRWTPIIHKGLPIIFPVGIRTDPHEICVIWKPDLQLVFSWGVYRSTSIECIRIRKKNIFIYLTACHSEQSLPTFTTLNVICIIGKIQCVIWYQWQWHTTKPLCLESATDVARQASQLLELANSRHSGSVVCHPCQWNTCILYVLNCFWVHHLKI